MHCLGAKYFDDNPIDENIKQESGVVGEVVSEMFKFRDAISQIISVTTEELTELETA